MAPTYLNAFDLLDGESGDEGDDITVLYDRIKNRAVEEVPSSPTKTRKEYVVYDEKDDEQSHENGNGYGNNEINGVDVDEDGWKAVPKKVFQQVQSNGQGQRTNKYGVTNYNGERRGKGYGRVRRASSTNGSEQSKGEGQVNGDQRPRNNGNRNGGGNIVRGNGVYRGRGRSGFGDQRINNGEVKESTNGEVKESSNGAVADANVNSEGDVVTIVEPSSGEEIGEKEKVEEVPEHEESAEEKKEREKEEKARKEDEERQQKRKEEAAERRREREEEAKKMTLAQYEKILLEKKQALNLQKAEARRVVAVDKDLENMKVVTKKRDDDETLTTETKLKKSDSLEKGPKPVAVGLTELFRPASYRSPELLRPTSFRGSNNGGRGQGRGQGNQGGFSNKYPNTDVPKTTNESHHTVTRPPLPSAAAKIPEVTDDKQFPILGFVPPKPSAPVTTPAPEPSPPVLTPAPEPTAPVANPSALAEPNQSTTKPNGSVPSKNRHGRGNPPGSAAISRGRGNPPGSAANCHANAGKR